MSYYEDWIFLTYSIVHARKIRLIKSRGYVYNNQNSNLTGRGNGFDLEKRIIIFKARYLAALELKQISEKCFQVYMSGVSLIMMQAIYKMYHQKPYLSKKLRQEYLKDFANVPINKVSFDWKAHLISVFFIRQNLLLSDRMLKIFRFV